MSADDGAPLVDVLLVLLDAGGAPVAEARSDDGGRFRIDAPEAGQYMVLLDQEGFANQLSDLLTLADGATLRLDLTVEVQRVGQTGVGLDTLEGVALLQAAVADACRDQFVPGLHGILFGAIRDEATGSGIPGASASLRWREGGMGVAPSEVRAGTDEAGAYLVCDAPAARRIAVQPSVSGVEGESETVTLRAGTMMQVDLWIPLSDPSQGGNIFGRVLDTRSGNPLTGARVVLREGDRDAVTNERGVFIMRDVPSGPDVVTIEMIGYAEQEQVIQVLGGRAQEVEIRMSTRPIELPPMLVEVQPRSWFSDRAGLEDRALSGNGVIFMRDDIDDLQPRLLGDMMRHVPGAQVRTRGNIYSGSWSVQFRGASNMTNDVCNPVIWLDGIKLGNDPIMFSQVTGPELDAVEVYRGAAEVPGEFSGGDARCGVVVVWTRRGRFFGG
ncbi:MAG: TonB-dependent receptor plug domain-containing protein [Gemmatimonadetes bacterium]|nr:TonB-dependent receptor plug domain-containing protein [Gemmatimonadota bacterium]